MEDGRPRWEGQVWLRFGLMLMVSYIPDKIPRQFSFKPVSSQCLSYTKLALDVLSQGQTLTKTHH